MSSRWLCLLLLLVFASGCSNGGPGTEEPSPSPAVSTPTTAAPSTPVNPSANPTITPQLTGPQLIEALRGGGYVIVFRHSFTDMSQTDRDPFVATDCSTQRNLNAAGRAQARALGGEIVRLGIPHGPALTSPYCRARETAGLAFGIYEVEAALQQQLSGDTASRADAINRLFSQTPPAGRNTVMVTHITNLTLVGLPLHLEGDSFVLRPTGTSWSAIAFLEAAQWSSFPTP